MSENIQQAAGLDPFDPASLRLDPSYADTVGVKKQLITVPVRKPNRQEFVRVHPDPAYRLDPAATIELKAERETYLLTRSMADALPGEFTPVALLTTISRQGVVFLWPVKLPGIDGKDNEWNRSAREGAEKAKTSWVRVMSNMSLGAYELFVAQGDFPEPEWPEIPFQEILRLAFREHYVDNGDHPLIKRLYGQA